MINTYEDRGNYVIEYCTHFPRVLANRKWNFIESILYSVFETYLTRQTAGKNYRECIMIFKNE